MRKILIVAALVFVGAAVYLMTDEQLSPLAVEFSDLKRFDNSNVSRAYRILLGMNAAEEDDAFEIGSKRISDYREAAGDAGILDKVEFSDYPQEQAIYVPKNGDHPLYCDFGDPGCLDEVALDSDGRRTELDRLVHLTNRYEEYLSSEEFRTELAPAANEPGPEYRHLLVANRMHIFAAYDQAETDQASVAIHDLLDDVRRQREKLAQSDNVVHKVITVALLRDSMNAIAHLHKEYDEAPLPPIPPLTSTERSFRKPLQHEFQLESPRAYTPLALENEEVWSDEFGSIWRFLRKLYHPNMVVNALAEDFDQQIHLSEVSAAAFAKSMATTKDADSRFFSIWPSMNALMKELSENDYLKYIGRVFDLDAKIALVNSRIARGNFPVENPYYPSESVALIEDNGRVCMKGPLTDAKYTRCLPFTVDSEVAFAE
jgi:hypothetical protein